jgi:hypothetical protein
MNTQEIVEAFRVRDEELKSIGIAAEFDGPVSNLIQDDLLADFRKDLAITLAQMQDAPLKPI